MPFTFLALFAGILLVALLLYRFVPSVLFAVVNAALIVGAGSLILDVRTFFAILIP